MPITSEEFNKGRKVSTLEKTILQFLRQHPDQAFTENEIAQAIGTVKGKTLLDDLVNIFTIPTVLNTLIKEGHITKRNIDSQTYYKIDPHRSSSSSKSPFAR
jgi:hypothetical protein